MARNLPVTLLPLVLFPLTLATSPSPGLPMVINTWGGPFTAATDAAYLALAQSAAAPSSALDAVEAGCLRCERDRCDGTVGFGGSPDERCETTLDALIMDGTTMDSGAVASLRRVKAAISVARLVLETTTHSLLAGDLATRFAAEAGFPEEDLATEETRARCQEWRSGGCQPNYRVNVSPDPGRSCGPYAPLPIGGASPGVGAAEYVPRLAAAREASGAASSSAASQSSHDTISLIAISSSGAMAAGTSTNGASHKVPGRVGDGPIVGSGSYVDGEVGGCGATGDGDVMMRFLPCYQAVENLRRGMDPTEAARDAVARMVRKYPDVHSGVVVVDRHGRHGGAGSGWTFTYAFRGGNMSQTEVVAVPPIEAARREMRLQRGEEEYDLRGLL